MQCKKASNFYTDCVDFSSQLRQHEWLNASRYTWIYQTLFSSLLKRPNIGFQKFRGFRLTIPFTRVLRSWMPFSSYFQHPDAVRVGARRCKRNKCLRIRSCFLEKLIKCATFKIKVHYVPRHTTEEINCTPFQAPVFFICRNRKGLDNWPRDNGVRFLIIGTPSKQAVV